MDQQKYDYRIEIGHFTRWGLVCHATRPPDFLCGISREAVDTVEHYEIKGPDDRCHIEISGTTNDERLLSGELEKIAAEYPQYSFRVRTSVHAPEGTEPRTGDAWTPDQRTVRAIIEWLREACHEEAAAGVECLFMEK